MLLPLLILEVNTLLALDDLGDSSDLNILRNSIIITRSSARYTSIKSLFIAKDFVESMRLL